MIVYFIHLTASVPLGLGIDLKLMCATPLVVAAAFHFQDGNDAATGFAIGACVLAFFLVTIMLQTQRRRQQPANARDRPRGDARDLVGRNRDARRDPARCLDLSPGSPIALATGSA